MSRARLAVLAVALGVTACDARSLGFAPPDHDNLTQRNGTIVVARPVDASSLDPARPSDNESAEVIGQIYETLVRYRPGSAEIEGALATRWEVDASGRVWTFQLRPRVRFHDGTPCDAAAVVFSFERQRDPQHPFHRGKFGYWENAFKNIERVEALDPTTVRITIADRFAPFLASMATFPVSIVSPTAVARWGDDFGDHPVGTGPFQLERWTRGERIVIVRNPHYWGPRSTIERVVFEVIPDPRQRLIDLESGAVDLALAILPSESQFLDLHPGLTLHRPPANNVTYLAMNCARPPFDRVEVRQAVAMAINKQAIVRLAYQGLATVADGPLPPSQWGYQAGLGATTFAPERARARLAELAAEGVIDLGRTYTLYAPSAPRPYLPNPEQVARIVRANLEAVGLHVEPILQPFAAQRQDTQAGRHDLALAGWVGDNGDPDNYLYLMFDKDNTVPGIARNIAFYRDDEVSALLRRAQRVEDRGEREALYTEAQRRIAADAPWVPLAHSQVTVAARVDLTGVVVNHSGHVVYAGIRRAPR
ncbi:MAG: ABC transporter substrate-binding protein [Myxococcales bacterium]|nr:ABC transporter substrate-binding protein [Myxococcales bacterium]